MVSRASLPAFWLSGVIGLDSHRVIGEVEQHLEEDGMSMHYFLVFGKRMTVPAVPAFNCSFRASNFSVSSAKDCCAF